eukprot:COSAG01_NODE_72430_length_253_cov_0.642857_1_plen_46_part_00
MATSGCSVAAVLLLVTEGRAAGRWRVLCCGVLFFNDTATTEIYTY